MGRTLIVLGAVIAAVGALIALGFPFGRLPGDVMVRRGSFTFYAPVTTSVLVSIVLTALAMFFGRR
jgi:hypothetical protein